MQAARSRRTDERRTIPKQKAATLHGVAAFFHWAEVVHGRGLRWYRGGTMSYSFALTPPLPYGAPAAEEPPSDTARTLVGVAAIGMALIVLFALNAITSFEQRAVATTLRGRPLTY